MLYIGIGCLAFFFFLLFDLNKIYFVHKWISVSFAIGAAFLLLSTAALWPSNNELANISDPIQWFWGALSLMSLLLLGYSLFMGIPFTKTYIHSNQENTVVNTGMYALCRHPGVLWFFFFYLFLWLASGKSVLMWAALAWTAMDVLYVFIQDRWLFPKTFVDYEEYKREVPFLIPNAVSIKKSIQRFRIHTDLMGLGGHE